MHPVPSPKEQSPAPKEQSLALMATKIRFLLSRGAGFGTFWRGPQRSEESIGGVRPDNEDAHFRDAR